MVHFALSFGATPSAHRAHLSLTCTSSLKDLSVRWWASLISTSEAHLYWSLCLQSSLSTSWSSRLPLDINVISLGRSSPFSSGGYNPTSHSSCTLLLVVMTTSQLGYWSRSPSPPPGELPDSGIEPMSPASPALQADSLALSHHECPVYQLFHLYFPRHTPGPVRSTTVSLAPRVGRGVQWLFFGWLNNKGNVGQTGSNSWNFLKAESRSLGFPIK